jgi:hypothetical protein
MSFVRFSAFCSKEVCPFFLNLIAQTIEVLNFMLVIIFQKISYGDVRTATSFSNFPAQIS